MNNRITDIQSFFIIFCISIFTFCTYNTLIPADLMESRNLATAQEMVREGNYLVPTMNGELRLEKPPLPTWMAAGIEKISPDNLSAQRCLASVAAMVMAFFLYLLVKKLTEEPIIGLMAGIILVTSFNVIMMGRTATWDIYCHSFMLIAIYCLVCALTNKGSQLGLFFISGLFMGFSFLSKGPISFYGLLLPFLISYGILERPSLHKKGFSIFILILACVAISLWWPYYIMQAHPEVSTAVADKESSSWLNHNVRPFWYYRTFPAEAGIWALFWVTSIFYFFFSRRWENRRTFAVSIFWTITCLVLLSLIPEKKTRYLLPLLIPGSINIAFYFWNSMKDLRTGGKRFIFRLNGLIIALIAFAIPVALFFLLVDKEAMSWWIFGVSSVFFIAIGIWILKGLYGHKGQIMPMQVFSGTVLIMVIFIFFCFKPTVSFFVNQERHSIHALRSNEKIKDMKLYHPSKDFLRMELVYATNKNIKPLDISNDKSFYDKLPLVLISSQPIKNILKGKEVKIEHIDTYDDNWRKPDTHNYNNDLVKHVAIIRDARMTTVGQDTLHDNTKDEK